MYSHRATINSVIKRQSMEWKYTDSLRKKKFWVQQSVKKVILTVFWDIKGFITIDFFEKVRLQTLLPINNFSGGQNSLYLLNDPSVYVYI